MDATNIAEFPLPAAQSQKERDQSAQRQRVSLEMHCRHAQLFCITVFSVSFFLHFFFCDSNSALLQFHILAARYKKIHDI